MNKKKWYAVLLGMPILLAAAAGCLLRPPAQVSQARVTGLTDLPVQGTFETVTGPRELVFPRDHGPHPDFRTEWWYYTGNLSTADGRRFGYQLTFFRRAVLPESDRALRESAWAADQIYMAHFTLTDAAASKFYYYERFERAAAGLAGAVSEPSYSVWLHDWSVEQVGENEYHLRAQGGEVSIDLTLSDVKGIILQGDHGYSQKGEQPGNASFYYSQTRLETRGEIRIGDKSYDAEGLSWLDREISSSVLSPGQVGWDWFALQLSDGSELMVYVLRRSDGTIDAFSNGTYVRADGSILALTRDDFQVTAQDTWGSPHSGVQYPAGWAVRVPAAGLDLEVQPLLADQELNVSFIYWEGAVTVQGITPAGPVTGQGYVELTGYAKSMEGDF